MSGRYVRVKRKRKPLEFIEEDVSPETSPRQRSEGSFTAEKIALHSTRVESEPALSDKHFDMSSNTKAQIATFTAVLSTLPVFPDNLDLNKARQHWKMFIRQFEDVCELRPDLDEKQKALLLRVKGGVTLQSIVRQLGEDVGKKGYEAIKEGINSYYNKHSVVQVDIEIFRAIRQNDTESFAAFMTRLRNQAEMCDFKDEAQADNEIAQMVIIGARDRKYIMQKLGDAGKMNLEELEVTGMRLEIANGYEKEKKPGSSFETAHMQTVNAVEKSEQKVPLSAQRAEQKSSGRGESRRERSRSRERPRYYSSSSGRERRRSRSRDRMRRSRSIEKYQQGPYQKRPSYTDRRPNQMGRRQGPCRQCGERCEGGRCAARGATCPNCGMRGHLLATCWSSTKKETNQVSVEVFNEENE